MLKFTGATNCIQSPIQNERKTTEPNILIEIILLFNYQNCLQNYNTNDIILN